MGQCNFLGQKFLYWPGTKGQVQNLAMGRDGPGQPAKIQDRTQDGTITIFLSKSRTGRGTAQLLFSPMISCFRTSFPVLERPFPVFERPFLF